MWIALLIIAAVLGLGVLITGLVFFILNLVQTIGGTQGGWRKLVTVYGSSQPITGKTHSHVTMQIGVVVYNRCVTLGVTDAGLWIQIWRKTCFIPWSEFKSLRTTTLYWEQVPLITVGEPPIATLTIPQAIFAEIHHKLPVSTMSRSRH